MGIRYSKPPVLMRDVLGDLDAAVRLLESQAPYTPLGGWYSPGADPHARTRPAPLADLRAALPGDRGPGQPGA